MNYSIEARKLANYVTNLSRSNDFYKESNHPNYNHIGALLTDIILQAGLNYNSVVRPRVKHVLLNYPYANTRPAFQEAVDHEGLENIILWKHHVKITRMRSMLAYAHASDINTCTDLRIHLSSIQNRKQLLEVKGIGPKTLDYLMKLLDFDTVAVDRHIYNFLKNAGIDINDYSTAKKLVEYAADFLMMRRSALDYSIWIYMSKDRHIKHLQRQLEFEF